MKKFISLFLILIAMVGASLTVHGENNYDLDNIISDTASYLLKTVPNPQSGSVGGEWAVLGLARSDADIPDEYYRNYYENLEKYVIEHEGNLHDKKYTEYSRVVLCLTAIGKDPRDVSGYNLLTPLGDYEKTIWQGLNGPVWALIALDSGNYEIPYNPDATIQATREMYIERILDCQLPDGGWSLFGGTEASEPGDNISDPDITGMVLQALSKYQDDERVKQATDRVLNTISKTQDDNGGFSSWGTANSESSVQILVALSELGISVDDPRFVKNGYTILDNLMNYYTSGSGFKHTLTDTSNLMATEQAFYGLVSLKRATSGKNSLYNMSDAVSFPEIPGNDTGLKNKHNDIQKISISLPDKTFSDIKEDKNKAIIESLASREIINGKTSELFDPDSTMTRAEFATIIVKSLGLPLIDSTFFEDITETDWFYSYVATAYNYGIIKGVSDTEFNPHGTITREEAAVMIQRSAKLCGIDTEMNTIAIRDVLSGFIDYVKASDWAHSSLAFCYNQGILEDDVMDIKPKEPIKRTEIAFMIYNMLSISKLL